MFTYLHLHTPFAHFSPSLISLMVSVDVKHHVYLPILKASCLLTHLRVILVLTVYS